MAMSPARLIRDSLNASNHQITTLFNSIPPISFFGGIRKSKGRPWHRQQGTMSLHNEVETTLSEETRLRNLLKEKPKNARLLSKLSSLLTDQSKLTENKSIREEALALSRLAIQYVPHKPFGYAALSSASLDHKDRMLALDKAIDLSASSEHVFARVGFMVRRLVEPRTEQARQVQGQIGRASDMHPSKKDLNDDERILYGETLSSLEEACSKDGIDDAQNELLAKNEYRLG